jgi:AmiR/NasT family two-component response regulator
VALALECKPDVVVLDVDMPELDGVEAARQILAARAVPIVMLTAFSYGELVSRALDAGVAGYVVKPFRETDLVEAIGEALLNGPDEDALVYLRRAAAPSSSGNKHSAAGDLAVPKLGEDVVHGIQ